MGKISDENEIAVIARSPEGATKQPLGLQFLFKGAIALCAFLACFNCADAWAANRYWVGGGSSANWNATGPTNWGSASNTRDNASVPGSSDDVFFNGVGFGASNSTLSADITIKSLDMTGYANTLTHNAAVTLTIAGSGVNFKLAGGMTYTLGNSTTSAISFTGTSGTTGITTAGKTLGNVTFNGAGGWQLLDSFTGSGAAQVVTFTQGTLDFNGKTVNIGSFATSSATAKSLVLGSSNITLSAAGVAWSNENANNCSVNAGTSTITLTGADAYTIEGHNLYNIVFSGGGAMRLSGSISYHNVTITGTAAKTDSIFLPDNVTVTGTFTVNGNSAVNRLLVMSGTLGSAMTITAAAVSASNVDFRDITGAGAGSWNLSAITGKSGDCGGNSGITFTPAATQTWSGTSGGNWSTNAWTSRVPLPQDDVVVNSAFSSGQTIAIDMPRAGHTLDFSGATWSGSPPVFSASGVSPVIYGSLKLPSGITSGTLNGTWYWEGRSGSLANGTSSSMPAGGWQVLSAGTQFNNDVILNSAGGTYQLQDNYNGTYLTITSGTFDANGHNVTLSGNLTGGTGSLTRQINMGSGTWTITGTSHVINFSGSTNLTLNAGTSTLVITDTSATAKNFYGNGYTYNKVIFSGDNINVYGSNTFNTMSVNNAGLTNGLILPSGFTQTVSAFTTNGSASNLAKLSATSAGSAATLSKASGVVSVDYMWIKDSAAIGGATWYAGANSTNVSGNSGWSFTSAPIRYWVGGGSSTNWNATGPTNWAVCSGCANNAPVPTAADDVYFDANSGTGTSNLNVAFSVKSLDCTGYTGTLTQEDYAHLDVAGSLTFSAGMTFAPDSDSKGIYLGGSGTLTTNGKLLSTLTVYGVGKTVTLGDNLAFRAAKTAKLAIGVYGTILDLNGKTISGNSAINRLLITGGYTGSQSITINGGTFANVDFRDVLFSNGGANLDLSAITGKSGDAGGNGMYGGGTLTFTAPATNYWVGNGGDWSVVNHWASSSGGTGGTGRVPLPQDTARFDPLSFSLGGQTVTEDEPRIGGADWTGATNSPKWTFPSGEIHGSITLISGMTFDQWYGLVFYPRGNTITLTSAGKTFNNAIFLNGPGTLSLQDAMTVASSFTHVGGTFVSNGKAMTLASFDGGYAANQILNLSGSTVTLTGTGAVWNFGNPALHTFDFTNSTLVISDTSATAKTFAGHDLTYNNITFSGDNITVTGSNTFNTMAVNNAGRTNGLIFTSGTTQTVSAFTTNGSAGNLAKIGASTPGSAATLSKASGTVTVDYMSIKDSAATGGATWIAGDHSANVSGNTGWIFTGRHWVGGGSSTNWDATGPTNWATCSGCTGDAPVPTSSENVYFDANSGSGTSVLSANITIKSLDMTGYTGTLTHNAGITLTIAGSGVVFKLASGMTYTLGDAATSAITFTGTSGTTLITTAGKILGNTTFNGVGGTWQLQDALNVGSAALQSTLTLTNGTFDSNNQTINAWMISSSNTNTRTLTLGSSTVNLKRAQSVAFDVDPTNLTVTANTATLIFDQVYSFFRSGAKDWNGLSLVFTGQDDVLEATGSTFANVTKTGVASLTDTFLLTSGITVTGTFTVNGNSATNRVLVTSDALGTARTITAATVSVTNADFRDITGAGAGSWNLSAVSGGSGNAGGNSGITFTPAATQYWHVDSGSWSDPTKWFLATNGGGGAGRVPLPQDNVVFDANSFDSAGRTVSVDMPRLGKSIDFSGVSHSPTADFNTNASFFGSMTFGSMTTSNAGVITFEGRSSYTLTSNGQGFAGGLSISAPGGTLTLQDDFLIIYSNRGIDLNAGTFNANNHNVNVGLVSYPGTYTAGFLMGSGTFTFNNAPNVWVFGYDNSKLTFNAGTSTIKINITNGSQRNFFPGSLTYNNLWVTGTGTGAFTMNYAGSPTFNDFKVDSTPARLILFLPGYTYTFTTFRVNGTAGNLISIGSNGSGTHSLVKSGGGIISTDYLSVSDSQASPANTWYAGGRSTNATPGTNTGWIFAYPPIRYWVGGGSSTSWDATGPTNWAVCSGCSNDVPVPTSVDDVFFDANSGSGNSTLSANTTIKSLDMTGYTGTLTHNASTTLTIAGSGVAFKLASGMTYTLGDTWSSAVAFTGTSGTTTITTAGKTLGDMTFDGVGGTWQLQDTITAAGVALANGTFDTNNQTATFYGLSYSGAGTRTLTFGSSAITITAGYSNFNWNDSTPITANTATITFTGAISAYLGNRNWNGTSFVYSGCGGQSTDSGTVTMANLTITGNATKTCGFYTANNLTATGTLTINGNSATNRVLVQSDTLGTARTITAGAVSVSNADFRDITGAGAGNWNLANITGKSGDCGGNTGITFTTPADQHFTNTSGGSWSTSGNWTSRVPLPQDNVFFDTAFGASKTVTLDMPRAGKSIDWTGATNNPAWTKTTNTTVYGSVKMIAGMTNTGTNVFFFEGRSSFSLTSAGQSWSNQVILNMFGGTLTLQDDFSSSQLFFPLAGTFNANNFNVAVNGVSFQSALAKTLTMGSGTWTLSSTGIIWGISDGGTTIPTINANSSAIIVSNTTATAKLFTGFGLTYNNITFSGDNITVTGSNTFNTMAVNNAGLTNGLIFTSGTTQTVSAFTTNGYAGNRAKITASTSGTAATLSKASGTVTVDWMSIKDSAATGGATWYAGYNSDSVSGNSGWIFPGRNWVGGGSSNDWFATGPTNWATCTGCTGNNAVPTSSEDVFFDSGSGSGNAVLSANTTIKSLDMDGYTGTLTHNAGVTLTLAGMNPDNRALRMSSGMTYTLGNSSSSALSFTGTSGTATITTAGKILGNIDFNGVGGTWQLQDAFTAEGITLSAGTWDTNDQTVGLAGFSTADNANAKALDFGASQINVSGSYYGAWSIYYQPGTVTLDAGTSTINMTGCGNFTGGDKTYNNVVFTGVDYGFASVSSSNTFNNLSRIGGDQKTGQLVFWGNQTITGTLTIQGASTINRIFFASGALGTATTITAANVSVSNADFRDITGAGAGSWNLSAITGKSGDCGGNSGITFTTGQTDYWVGGTGNWSDVNEWANITGGTGGTGRVPLPQDDVRFDGSSFSSGGQTVTTDMPRTGKSIDWTNATNTPTWGWGTNETNYGSITLIAGMNLANGGYVHVFEGRGVFTFTSAGQSWHQTTLMFMVGGSLTLQDDYNGVFGFNHGAGTFNANNHNFTAPGYNTDWGGLARTLTMGSGTWTLTGTGNIWYMLAGGIPTVNPDTSTIVITNTSATVKNFMGAGRTYNNITFTGDNITVTGSNTFNNFAVNNAGFINGLNLASGATQTITGNFTDNGSSASSLVDIRATIGGTAATISKASGTVNGDYMILQDSAATGGATWYAGAHSINVSGNSGWSFTSPSYIRPFDGLLLGGD